MYQNRGRERGGNPDGYRNGYSGGGSNGNRGGFGGRGGFRGGRGGGRGGGHGQDIRVFSPAGGRTNPKAAIKNLEDKIVKLDVPKNDADFSVQRPAYGTNGTKVTLYTNFVEMDIDKNLELHRYAIFIKPEARDKRKEQIIRLLVQQLNKKGVVSDYAANLITTSKLDGGECQTISVQYRNETESVATEKSPVYQVKLEYRKTMALSELLQDLKNPHVDKQYQVNKDEVIQALNIVLKDHAKASNDRFTIGKNQGGNRIYSKDDNATQADIGEGAIALRGFFTSVRPATDRLLLNINVSNGAFYKAKRLDELFTSDFRQFVGWFDSGFRALDKNFAKLKVMTTHLPERKNSAGEVIHRYKTIIGFADPKDGAKETYPPRVKEFAAGPNDVSFWFEENSEFAKGRKPAAPGYRTVTDHFRIAYGIKVSNYYPVLNVGTKEKPSYIPAEVCQVVKGQAWRKLLSALQTDKMLKFSGRAPYENADAIVNEGFKTVGLTTQINPRLNDFGIDFGKSLLAVEGRVLDPPKVKYGRVEADTRKNPGQWNLAQLKFSTAGKPLNKWAVLFITTKDYKYTEADVGGKDKFMGDMMGALQKTGIQCSNPSLVFNVEVKDDKHDKGLEEKMKFLEQRQIHFVVTVLPSKDAALYARVKRICDVDCGIQNISVVSRTVASMKHKGVNSLAQYFANIALKFNMKLGGTNQLVQEMQDSLLADGKTMIIGLDVTHPSPGSAEGTPSVAAMVSSIDKNLAQWPAILSIQAKAKQEDITDLKEMMRIALKRWKDRPMNNCYPENIIVYRDGVSEGQFEKVLQDELSQLREVCRELYNAKDQKNNLPRFTVMVVTKRHQTRFYPADARDADRKSNTKPGTTVDRGITEAQRWTFYQQGHAAIQGTARSAKYDVLLDEVFSHAYSRGVPPKFGSIQDVVESFNLGLCYIYGRATKAVSLCTPAKYADMACERARCYLSHYFIDDKSSATSKEVLYKKIRPHDRIKESMFYL